MLELTDLLDKILHETRFDVKPYGTCTAARFHSFHTRGDPTGQYMVNTAKVVVPDALLAGLVERLDPELQAYIEPDTQRIGTGLVSLMGGALDSAEPKVTDFARTLVRAAAMLGSARAVRILRGWIAGEPYHYRMMVLLTGVRCEQPLALEEGVRVTQLPTAGSSADLAPYLPSSLVSQGISVLDFLGRAVLSIDGTAGPALYRPTRVQGDEPDRNLQQVWAGGQIPCFMTNKWRERFSEVLSLACDHYVIWTHIWRNVGDIQAFSLSGHGYESHDVHFRGDAVRLTREHLEDARALDNQRSACTHCGKYPDMAIRRWVRSKRPDTTITDRFIDLRIALESLYLPNKPQTELRFRLALLGAWHLGTDFEERRRYFKLLKKAYDLGSAAVHAGHVEDTQDNRKNLFDAQRACRTAILKRFWETEEHVWNEVDVALGAPTHVVSS